MTMSNGDLVCFYYNGTSFGYKAKSGGSWTAAQVAILALTGDGPNTLSVLTRATSDVLEVSGCVDPITGTTHSDWYQLTYSTATHLFTTTNSLADAADGNEKTVGVGYISAATANDQVAWLHGSAAGNFATVQEMNVNPTISGIDQVPTFTDYRSGARCGVVVDGSTATYLIYACASSGTAFAVERFAAGTNADNVESPPAPAANPVGISAVHDGTNYIFVANVNNATLRVLTRTGTNTYGTWTTIVTDSSLAGQPAVCKKANGDLIVFYRTNKNFANGEIFYIKRIAGTWDGSPTLLAGGANTGWANPSCAYSDTNDAGNARVVYVTGTSSTWTLVEDVATWAVAAVAGGNPVTYGYSSN
jgi:hypothetical protein